MNCPVCDEHTAVVDSRSESDLVVRRRKCKACGYYFFTTEIEMNESQSEFSRVRKKLDEARV